MIEKGMVMDFGSMNAISDQREQVTDQDMNHSRAVAVQRSEMSEKDSGASDPVQLGQARTRKCGKILAPLRGPNRILHSAHRRLKGS
jgi:hypothetical protein